jgi:hypothetical protein
MIAFALVVSAEVLTTVRRTPGGLTSINIRNTANLPLSALAVAFQVEGKDRPFVFKELIDATLLTSAFRTCRQG